MSRDELLARLQQLADDDDWEERHMHADAALLEFIADLEISQAFWALEKWYA